MSQSPDDRLIREIKHYITCHENQPQGMVLAVAAAMQVAMAANASQHGEWYERIGVLESAVANIIRRTVPDPKPQEPLPFGGVA